MEKGSSKVCRRKQLIFLALNSTVEKGNNFVCMVQIEWG